MPNQASREDIKRLYQYYLHQHCSISEIARQIGKTRGTVSRYLKRFEELEKKQPGKQLNLDWYFRPFRPRKMVTKQITLDLIDVLPSLIANCPDQKNLPSNTYIEYHKLYPDGYSFDGFRRVYQIWKKANNVCVYSQRKVTEISEEDSNVLNQWRWGLDLEKWRKAVVIQGSMQGLRLIDLQAKVEIGMRTLHKWITDFKDHGIGGLTKKQAPLDPYIKITEEKTKNLMKLLHQSPKLLGFNRASWRLEDLSQAYFKEYGVKMSITSARVYIKRSGFRFRKARMVLTSPDPKFREKIDRVKSILSNLNENEKFFSMDEFGPFAIKMKAGWSYILQNEIKPIPQIQKSKGWLICTAAIELSTNQITHFYSLKKNSDEMIKLIEILILEYKASKRLYISGDSASWHSSSKLKEHIERVNQFAIANSNRTPFIELVPLPSSAQFLNVIESIFSGLAKAVIHNSDYDSLEECRIAIDRHFRERNAYFKKHPKRAGKMIWGKEVVKSSFDETQNCKDPVYAR